MRVAVEPKITGDPTGKIPQCSHKENIRLFCCNHDVTYDILYLVPSLNGEESLQVFLIVASADEIASFKFSLIHNYILWHTVLHLSDASDGNFCSIWLCWGLNPEPDSLMVMLPDGPSQMQFTILISFIGAGELLCRLLSRWEHCT